MNRFPCHLVAFAWMVLASPPAPASGVLPPVFWLGSGAGCNFVSLSVAIGAVPDGAIIHIANNQSYNDINLSIVNRSLTLRGGWADCLGTPSTQRAVLNGMPAADFPVLRIQSASVARSVTLQQLQIQSGTRSGLELSGLIDVQLIDSVINGNEAFRGGGVRISGTSPQQSVLRVISSIIGNPQPSTVAGNTATQSGGGIDCANARVELSGALIQDNHSDSHGGGLALGNCLLDTGSATLTLPPPASSAVSALIIGNSATFFGGGVYATSGSHLALDADVGVVQIHDNVASRGGGIYLSDAGTRLDSRGIVLSGNTATTFGGAAFLQNGAVVSMRRGADGSSCAPNIRCSRVVDNQVVALSTTGASAFNVANAILDLRQTEVSGNASNQLLGAAIAISANGNVRIQDSLLHHNDGGDGQLIRMSGMNTVLAVSGSTLADNMGSAPVVRVDSSAGTAQLHFDRSIIWQPGVLVHNAGTTDTVTSLCMNAHESTSIAAVTNNPGFSNAGDYRLTTDSINIDACTDPGSGDYFDIVDTPRPIALIAATPFDRGAYERRNLLSDLIFADGFE